MVSQWISENTYDSSFLPNTYDFTFVPNTYNRLLLRFSYLLITLIEDFVSTSEMVTTFGNGSIWK